MSGFSRSDFTSRTAMLIGAEGVERLSRSSVLVFGAGGVGGYVIEALARAGVGRIGVVDADTLSSSNLNRQILATVDTVGSLKTEAAKSRINSINPDCVVDCYPVFYSSDTLSSVPISDYDYVVDAIDTVSAKVVLAVQAQQCAVPLIASMSTGNKLSASFVVADVYKTHDCPLAKVLRRAYRDAGISSLDVVYSPLGSEEGAGTLSADGRHIPGSISYVPAQAGLTLAGEVIRRLLTK